MTPSKLRESLLLLLPVGTYTYQGGATTPAIAFDQPGNDMSVSGIEIILPSYPRVTSNCHTDMLFHSDEEWQITFYNHDLSDRGHELFFLAIETMFSSWERIMGNPIPQINVPDSLPGYRFVLMTTGCRKTQNPYNLNSAGAFFGV